MSKKYLDIDPNNVPASGKVSFKNGNPVLTFTVGRQNGFLDLSSLRVGGNLQIWRNAAGTLRPAAGGGANATEAMASQKLGVYGAFDQLIFRHAETKQVAEHIRHYSRFMSSYLPTLAGSQDQLGHLSESALIMPSYEAFQNTVVRNTTASSWCVPLPSGMTLGGGSLPLNQFPLEIEIHLSPDSQFFYSQDGTTTNIADCFYELESLSLTCEVIVPEGGVMPQKAGMFSFNSITSYFATLESTNSIINYQLALSKVLGAFVNFVPSNFVNNLAQDGFLTYMPAKAATGGVPAVAGGALANMSDITFLRNGERFPYHFETKTNYSVSPTTQVVDPQVIKQFLSSIIPEDIHNRTSVSPVNSNRNYTVNDSVTTSYRYIPEGGAAWGVGVLYDMLDSEGVDFTNAQFSIQMTNGLDDGNPVSAYLFIKHKTTIAYSEGGVQVIS